MPPWLMIRGTDLLLSVLLMAGAERTRVVGVSLGRLKVSVEAPVGPLANDALVRLVVRLLGVARPQVSIVGGVPVSKQKTLRLAGVEALRARLALRPEGPLPGRPRQLGAP